MTITEQIVAGITAEELVKNFNINLEEAKILINKVNSILDDDSIDEDSAEIEFNSIDYIYSK